MSKAYEDLKKKRGRPTETVHLHTRHDLDAEIARLEQALRTAEREDTRRAGMVDSKPKAPEIAQQILDLEEQARADALPVTFAEIGRRAWRDLVEKHPPTEDQKAEVDAELEANGEDNAAKRKSMVRQMVRWNDDTFPPAAMAASCVEPEGLTEDDFAAMADEFGEGEFNRLFGGCLTANMKVRELPNSARAYEIARSSTPRLGPQRDSE